MRQFSYEIIDELGLHARPAGLLVKKASEFESEISVVCGNASGDAKKLFSMMKLCAKQGDRLVFTATGGDEELVEQDLLSFLKDNL